LDYVGESGDNIWLEESVDESVDEKLLMDTEVKLDISSTQNNSFKTPVNSSYNLTPIESDNSLKTSVNSSYNLTPIESDNILGGIIKEYLTPVDNPVDGDTLNEIADECDNNNNNNNNDDNNDDCDLYMNKESFNLDLLFGESGDSDDGFEDGFDLDLLFGDLCDNSESFNLDLLFGDDDAVLGLLLLSPL
jgi:hypothetical protein